MHIAKVLAVDKSGSESLDSINVFDSCTWVGPSSQRLELDDMDLERPIEVQFSKLHPSLPENTRIGIVGAGPSGLSAAYALARLGYKNITVLEKHHTVGGMCESVEIEGKVYDLGGQVLAANSAPVIFHLARETASELEELDSHKLAVIDHSTFESFKSNLTEKTKY
ncbi:hypothetical protein VNO80_24538 [Phaseolus coccineus]|uniref:Amine oxidase domain-containing protein n=1 Tax=Phaseolus coccineus TaxID=3886 RepID=A0AAN9LXG3_PHACN